MKLILLALGLATVLPIVFFHTRYRRKATITAVTTWVFFLGGPILLAGGFVGMTMASHTADLHSFKNNFENIAHPGESLLIARYAEFGDLGASEYCGYFVGELRTSTLQKEEITNFYGNQTIPPPNATESNWKGGVPTETEVVVSFVDDPRIEGLWWLKERIKEDLPKIQEHLELVYIVSVSEDGYESFGDLRCGEFL